MLFWWIVFKAIGTDLISTINHISTYSHISLLAYNKLSQSDFSNIRKDEMNKEKHNLMPWHHKPDKVTVIKINTSDLNKQRLSKLYPNPGSGHPFVKFICYNSGMLIFNLLAFADILRSIYVWMLHS